MINVMCKLRSVMDFKKFERGEQIIKSSFINTMIYLTV